MSIRRVRQVLAFVLIGAFFALSMAEAVAMPQALAKTAGGMAMTDMPDCANMKMPMPCKDPNALCLGAVCIPVISFSAPTSLHQVAIAWTRQAYEARLLAILSGRSIAPALEPPILAG